MIKNFFKKNWKEIVFLVILLVVFLVLRLPAIHAPYHQDEYKWPMYANPVYFGPGVVPHPPLTEFIYVKLGHLVGYDNFRLIPLSFACLNLLLLYFFVRRRFSLRSARWSVIFLTLSFYGVLASLMVDTDGQILPFFLLLSFYCYDSFNLSQNRKNKITWGSLTFVFVILGIMVKLSAALVPVAIGLDFLFLHYRQINRRQWLIYFLLALSLVVAVIIGLFISQYIFTGFSLGKGIKYWETFNRAFDQRNFFQTGIQFAKSLLYLSPFLVGAILFSFKKYRREFNLIYFYLLSSLVFYLLIFDFSIGALDRYFEFLIIPACLLAGVLTADYLEKKKSNQRATSICLLGSIVISLLVFSLQFLPQNVPALYPKKLWLDRIVSGQWDFLYPFFGGSGPLGFYLSFNFLAWFWLATLFFFLVLLLWSKNQRGIWLSLLIFAVVYNGVFIEEYLFGRINGSARSLVEKTVDFIKNEPTIERVMVYNDNGGYNIRELGKYERRIYATPDFENFYRQYFKKFSGHIMFIDIPRLYSPSFYEQYFNQCQTVYKQTDRYLTAKVISCHPYDRTSTD